MCIRDRLRPVGGLDIAFDPAAFQVVEAGGLSILEVDEVAGGAPDGDVYKRQLEWDPPTVEGECILPAGYGFTVKDIQYSAATRS